jgi:hypothetical protein
LSEVRSSPVRHRSEQDPAYLKLMMMEQALADRIYEDEMGNATPQAGSTTGLDPQQAAALAVKQKMDKISILISRLR